MSTSFSLGFFPTPLHELARLSEQYPDYTIYIKRDDQTGLASGGNKTRKLEFLIQEALNQGCNTVITSGAQQSNHCRQTAAACALAGLECHLLLGGDPPATFEGNLLLSSLLGAHIHFTGSNRKGEDKDRILNDLQNQGKDCYVIPYGGSNLKGAMGFVSAVKELKEQLLEQALQIDCIVFASSSGGMQAGLTLGLAYHELNTNLIPISIDKEQTQGQSLEEIVLNLVQEGGKVLDIQKEFTAQDIVLNRDYDHHGYGVITPNEKKALAQLAKTEGILLDPVYTARAFYGLMDLLDNKKIPAKSKVLFWHTGGLPAVFKFGEELQ